MPLPAWSPEALRTMDWKRFQELTSLVLARAGFDSEIAWVRPNGAVVLHVTSRGRRSRMEALVQCAAWSMFHVDATSVLEFYRAVVSEGVQRGIYVTPGSFGADARLFSRNKRLELLDGEEFLGTIRRMSAEEQNYYFRMATVGPWNVPTCPSCGQKMEVRPEAAPRVETDDDFRRDLTLKERHNVCGEVRCRHLTVKRGADILFLKSVQVERMTVEGRVMGNIVCDGLLTIAQGACVSGLVAARSIRLEPGGLLEAEARILNVDEIRPVDKKPERHVWGCPGYPRCKTVLPVRE